MSNHGINKAFMINSKLISRKKRNGWKFMFIKAYKNSYIPLETAAIFFLSHFYLTQDIGKVHAMVDLICMGLF